MNGLGVRQRRMLTDMAVFGHGHWPEQWRFRPDDRSVLENHHCCRAFQPTCPAMNTTRPASAATPLA